MNYDLAILISLAVTLLGSLLGVILPRRYALVPLALSLCLYPSNILIPPDGVGLTPQRVIGLALLIRCISSRQIRQAFHWSLLDTAAAGYFGLLLLAQLMSIPPQQALVNRAGFFLSAMVPFWCTRMLITDRQAFYCLLKGWIWGAVPLAMVGFYQMQTGDNPYFQLQQYGILWAGPTNNTRDMRLFMGHMYYRASSPFMQCIMFGWFFAMLIPLCTNLIFEKRSVFPWIIPWCILPIGVISAVAAGPMMFAGFSVFFLAMFPFRRFGKIAIWVCIIAYCVAYPMSNRSPMQIIANQGMDPTSSWYRVGLQDQVLSRGAMTGHWLAGYGTEVPASIGHFHDLCIHWVSICVFFGLLGLVGFYGFLAVIFRQLWKAKDRATSVADQWLLWSILAAMLASLLAMLVVSVFAEMYYIYHMFLALAGNAGLLIGASSRQVGLVADFNGQKVLVRYTLKAGQRLAIIAPTPHTPMPHPKGPAAA